RQQAGLHHLVGRPISLAAKIAAAGVCYYKACPSRPAALLGSVTQGRFKMCVAMAPLLRHTLIAILAKEGRWLVIFKYAAALLVLEENHPQRCVESSGELMTGHLSGSEWIANLIEQGVAF